MNKLDGLIKRLCPDGVPYLPLSACVEYTNRHIAVSELDEISFVSVDNLLPNRGGKTNAKRLPRIAQVKEFSANDILVGNIRPYLKKIWLADRFGGCSGDVLAIHIREQYASQLQPQFLYYLLSSDSFFQYDQKHANGGTIPRGNKKQILNYRIPLPPIQIQRELVHFLEAFTSQENELEKELSRELDARFCQYAYYRDSLFINEAKATDAIPLGKLGTFIRGQGLQKRDFVTTGFNCIHYGQIYTNYDIETRTTKSRIPDSLAARLRQAHPGDLVIATTSENDQDVCKAVAWVGKGNVAISGDAYIFRHQLNPLYASFLFSSSIFQKQKIRYITGTKVRRVSGENLAKILVPVPPIERQIAIASILQKFHSLISGLSASLPAEIETRHKQYEYYRNQLLSFKELRA